MGDEDEDTVVIVNSALSGPFTQDGLTVDVEIYRGEDELEWVLEVVDEEGGSTVWHEPFPTD